MGRYSSIVAMEMSGLVYTSLMMKRCRIDSFLFVGIVTMEIANLIVSIHTVGTHFLNIFATETGDLIFRFF